jgi:two-component system sensor kinase FixL
MPSFDGTRADAYRCALSATEALAQWHASVNPARGRIDWCSDALTRTYPQWTAEAPVAMLATAFPGLGPLLDRPTPESPRSAPGSDIIEAFATAPDGRPLRVQTAPGPDGRLHLRLSDLGADGESASRHLSDRERLLFVSRSMSVGEMASILAHELNQPIGAIANLLRGIAMRIDRGAVDPDSLSPAVAQGIEQVLYAAGILERVREYVEPRQPRQESIALPALVGAAIALLDWEIRRDDIAVTLFDRTSPHEGIVAGDPVMLQQVIVNLARNAIEAMRGIEAGQRRLEVTTALDDDTVLLRIADRGCGIDPQAQARLFTPFFTTKPNGTGLGLHVCRSIIELHQGRLWFDTRENQGCTVCVALPALESPMTSRPSR